MEELEDQIEADDLEWSEQGFSLRDAHQRWRADVEATFPMQAEAWDLMDRRLDGHAEAR